MPYSPENGDIADAAYRRQSDDVVAGNYLVEPAPKASIGDSTTSIDIDVSAGTSIFGGDVVPVAQQTVTLPDGPAAGSGPQGGDPERVDLITINASGDAGRMVGTPAVPLDGDGNPTQRSFPKVRQPVPQTPKPEDDIIVIAAINVDTGITASQEMFADAVIPREIMGDGVNDLDLIAGRDLQYRIGQAREGETLVGDRSQTIVLDQPLTVTTPDVTIRNLSLKYADGTAANDTDDMLTVEADGVTIEDVTIDGNKRNQTVAADGITVRASDVKISDIKGSDTAGHLINLNGGVAVVEDSKIERVVATGCEKDALVIQGDNTNNTTAIDITAKQSGARGTVTVRNGPNETTLEDIGGVDQRHTINIEDFGPSNDASSSVVGLSINGATSSGCDWLINGEVSKKIDHKNIRCSGLRGGRFTPSGTGLVQLSYIDEVRVTGATLVDKQSQASTILVYGCKDVWIDHCRVRDDAPDTPVIDVVNSEAVDISNNVGFDTPGTAIRVFLDAQSSGEYNIATTTNNRIRGADTGIVYDEHPDGGSLRDCIVKNNPMSNIATTNVDVTGVSGTVIQEHNP